MAYIVDIVECVSKILMIIMDTELKKPKEQMERLVRNRRNLLTHFKSKCGDSVLAFSYT